MTEKLREVVARMTGLEVRTIPGHPTYFADSNGDVWSADFLGSGRPGRLKKGLSRTPTKYYEVTLARMAGRRTKTFRVHRLIAQAFHGIGAPGLQVRHLNGDQKDNRPSNLAWGTCLENSNDRTAHGRKPIGRKIFTAKFTEPMVAECRQLHREGASLPFLAAKYGVVWNTVNDVVKFRTWKHVDAFAALDAKLRG